MQQHLEQEVIAHDIPWRCIYSHNHRYNWKNQQWYDLSFIFFTFSLKKKNTSSHCDANQILTSNVSPHSAFKFLKVIFRIKKKKLNKEDLWQNDMHRLYMSPAPSRSACFSRSTQQHNELEHKEEQCKTMLYDFKHDFFRVSGIQRDSRYSKCHILREQHKFSIPRWDGDKRQVVEMKKHHGPSACVIKLPIVSR